MEKDKEGYEGIYDGDYSEVYPEEEDKKVPHWIFWVSVVVILSGIAISFFV